MLIGTTKTVNHQNPGNCLHADTQCLSHPDSGILDQGSLADSAHRRSGYPCHYHNLPYLEAQTR